MSRNTPEDLESRYQRAKSLAQRSSDRALVYMGLTLAGVTVMPIVATYIGEKYYPITNTLEEIAQGQMTQATETAVWASVVGIGGFEIFCIASAVAFGCKTYQTIKYGKEASQILKEMEFRSKRPPTLRS